MNLLLSSKPRRSWVLLMNNPRLSREDELEGRVIELESAIRWWYVEKMRNYNDSQYGKGELKRILNNNPIVKPLD